jgi:hypothetical protein
MADHKRLRVQAGQPEVRMAALADTRYALALNPGTSTGGHPPRDAASPQTPGSTSLATALP